MRKRLLRSAINKRMKELQHLSKELSLSEKFYRHSFLLLISTSLQNCVVCEDPFGVGPKYGYTFQNQARQC